MAFRGTYLFEVSENGVLADTQENLEKMRELLLDKEIIGNALGPGDEGDFDYGAWHVICHLAAGAIVYRAEGGEIYWVEISHMRESDTYAPTVTSFSSGKAVRNLPLFAATALELFKDARLLGFVEGSSLGHISARDVTDPPDRFNQWVRQAFDQPEDSTEDGGRVWEHWCTVRDIRKSNVIGTSVLRSYLSLLALAGGRFAAMVARGRTDYDHPVQLAAMVKAGLVGREDVLIDLKPKPIPRNIELMIYSADPAKCAEAAAKLPWPVGALSYFMFERRIERWNPLERVSEELANG
jgi:hypothetical protein